MTREYMGNYILDDKGNPVLEKNWRVWGKWMEDTANRRVAWTELLGGTVKVSTVFLGIDHGWGEDQPVLWETMIFGGKHDGDQWRYTSREAALAGHKAAVKLVTGNPIQHFVRRLLRRKK